MMLALWLVAMVVAAGCDNVISARELVKRTSGDKVNTIMWYYIGSENGCDCFCHEMMCLSASLPCPSVSHKTYYAVRSSEFPMFTRRFYWAPKVHGIAVLNPETDAPTMTWLTVRAKENIRRAKENIRIFAWIIMLVFGMGMIGGGIKGAVSVLFRDGIFSRWWIGALIAFGGLKLMQYLAVKLKASSTRKRRKKRKGNRGTKV